MKNTKQNQPHKKPKISNEKTPQDDRIAIMKQN